MGQDSAAVNSYEAFLNLWRNADNDVPIYRDAKAEDDALRAATSARSRP